MQIKRQANSTARAKALVDKTKGLFSVITNAIKYSELTPSPITPPTFVERSPVLFNYESDRDPELLYSTPPFAQRFTSDSQLSGSIKSTSTAPSSIFSRHTYQTAITVAGEGDKSYLEKDDVEVAASPAVSQDSDLIIRRSKPARGSFSLQAESSDDESHLEPSSGEEEEDDDGVLFIRSKHVEEEEDDDGVLFIRSKHVEPLQPVFASSLAPRNAYAAFLSQPLYKSSYIFPATRRAVGSYDG